ncbi:putative endopeptidase precursor [Corynebacterium capitovis DSM 44611]|uniref:C40 family peptidase n=1 Tax=Corynebacterium capitovis TaxID=131081 RepID=UPI000363ACD7|nr:C40 family peptidase [Corynebacterium capitovis]WKD57342.1 putative endopeptidase precursor [Corynebacterium capitovis DSM 44611]
MEIISVAKHRRQEKNMARNVAAVSAVAAGAALFAPAQAGAAEVRIPNSTVSVEVPGLENVAGLASVPGIEQYVPSLAQASSDVAEQVADTVAAPAAQQTAGERIVEIARSKIGSPYVYGASGPNSFDCSGFTSWVYAQAGKSIPRTSQDQASSGQQVSLDQLQPGDIVSYYSGASHVAIYAGNGTIIDALNDGIPVGERPLDMMPIYNAVRF